jgi:hypothetical protein
MYTDICIYTWVPRQCDDGGVGFVDCVIIVVGVVGVVGVVVAQLLLLSL